MQIRVRKENSEYILTINGRNLILDVEELEGFSRVANQLVGFEKADPGDTFDVTFDSEDGNDGD